MTGRAAKLWWLVTLLVLVSLCLLPVSCQPDPNAILARVPVGSKLSHLSGYLKWSGDGSKVDRWVRDDGDSDGGAPHTTNEFGGFTIEPVGTFEGWGAGEDELDSFTGEVTFFHHSSAIPDDIAPSFMLAFVYVGGVLKKKDWGVIPG